MKLFLPANIQLFVAALVTVALILYLLWGNGKATSGVPSVFSRRLEKGITILLAVVALVTGINYFYLSRSNGSWIHRWDLFHTVTSARFFKELGYTRLYECTYVVDAATDGNYSGVTVIRDLETLKYTDPRKLIQSSGCEARFTPARRKAFVEDLRFWNDLMPRHLWRQLSKDKGYNGTPFYTVLMQMLFQKGALTKERLYLTAFIDVILILVAFVYVARSFGFRIALLAFIFFCVNFPNRFVYMGGSVLRFGYLASVLIGLCMMRQRRYSIAGVLFALAGFERIFPFLFAVGLAIKAGYDSIRSQSVSQNYIKFFGFFIVTILLGTVVSVMMTGIDAWPAFLSNMKVHNQNTASVRIGFQHLLMLGDGLNNTEAIISFADKTVMFSSKFGLYFICMLGFFAAFGFLLPRLDEVRFTILFGLLTFYLLFNATRYYYSVLVLLFLLQDDSAEDPRVTLCWLLLFQITAVMYMVQKFVSFYPFMYNTLLSALILAIFLYLILIFLAGDRWLVGPPFQVKSGGTRSKLPSWRLVAVLAVLGVAIFSFWQAWIRGVPNRQPPIITPLRLIQGQISQGPWIAEGNVTVPPEGIRVVMGNTRHAHKINISYDHDDNYTLGYILAGKKIAEQKVATGPRRLRGGLVAGTLDVPKLVRQKGFDEIHISAEAGDGHYSIGHLVLNEGGNTPKAAPFFLDQGQSGGFAQFVSNVFAGSNFVKSLIPQMGLNEPCLGAYITLRDNGKLRDFSWSGKGTVFDCLQSAIRKIRARSTLSATEGHRTLEVWIILAEYPVNLRRPGGALVNLNRGIHGLRLEYNGKMSRFSPTEMIASNLSFKKALEVFQRRIGIARWQLLYKARAWTSEGVQMIINLGDVPEVRLIEHGKNLVTPEALSRQNVSNMAP